MHPKVLYVAAECKPFSKVGGVGDVAGELPVALRRLGVDIEIVTPAYNRDGGEDFAVTFFGRPEPVGISRAHIGNVPVSLLTNKTYFGTDYSSGHPRNAPVDHPELFRHDYTKPYVNSPRVPFIDDALRFSFFSEACLTLIEDRQPDVVHINDWPLGYLFGYMALRQLKARRVLTIHNVGYQGNLWRADIDGWNIERLADDPDIGPLFDDPRAAWKSLNPLRLAMELAHQTNTVSPRFKREMVQPEDPARVFEGGKGLEAIAARLDARERLHGILNGFEYQSDASDTAFAAALRRKTEMKAALADAFKNPEVFLVGFVGRAVEQKFRLLTEVLDGKSVLEHVLDLPGVNVAILASGLPEYEAFIRQFVGRPNFAATIAFDWDMARRISLGSDVFLMPSLFEPCGITQLESMSCATPPLVRWTGGLVDTVTPHTESNGTGFGFDGATGRAVLENLVETVRVARDLFASDPTRFKSLQREGFKRRYLWSQAAEHYLRTLYRKA